MAATDKQKERHSDSRLVAIHENNANDFERRVAVLIDMKINVIADCVDVSGIDQQIKVFADESKGQRRIASIIRNKLNRNKA